ncbi:hypothetical protein Poly41_48580 [Novipirellula artificiosorum]|uniref:Uncharacterized protein n=1 Tax=Novipirellula artificiosorum TaxID=2528016 RepID=A0A5C6DAX3_9BACT|nr:hypothetical protein Poly41_48580 [Novipirellula artificiosorum]
MRRLVTGGLVFFVRASTGHRTTKHQIRHAKLAATIYLCLQTIGIRDACLNEAHHAVNSNCTNEA